MSPAEVYTADACILLEALQGTRAQVWSDAWRRYVAFRLAAHAYGQIDFATGETTPGFLDLDDPLRRSNLVQNDASAVRDCTALMMESKAALDAVFLKHGIRKRTKPRLQALLNDDGVVTALIDSPTSVSALTSVSGEEIWRALAHKIGRGVYADEAKPKPDPEWLLWNKLLLSRFFYACQLSSAQQVAGQLTMFARGFHGPRSSLLAITERVSDWGVVDPALPPISSYGSTATSLKEGHLSDLLGAVEYESQHMQCGQGIVHRYADPTLPVLIPAHLRGQLTQHQLVVYRDHAYRQYEAAFLSYGALSAIEQLLRSLASHLGIIHLKDDGTPKSVGIWLARLGLDVGLLARLENLYSADGPNLRNRAMHAGLFETNSRSMEVVLAARTSGAGPTSSRNTYIAENLLKAFLGDLGDLDTYSDTVGLNAADFSWAEKLWLSGDEVEFGHRVYCDVLDPKDGDEWQRQLFGFIDHSLPCLATPARVAFMGWLSPFEKQNSLISFLIWGTVFEALYRLTLHVMGSDVIQRSLVRGTHRMFQYRMLDSSSKGLCAPEVIVSLVAVLRPEDRHTAERTIALAMKARNAFSHGAIVTHSEESHLAAGHLIIKATQLLMEVTKQHMTREAAYFRHLRRLPFNPGDPVDDWLKGEDKVYALLGQSVHLPQR